MTRPRWMITKYKVTRCKRSINARYAVYRKKWWSPVWWRCSGFQDRYDVFESVEIAKKHIPLYDQGSCYWVGTMVDLTKERLGVSDG